MIAYSTKHDGLNPFRNKDIEATFPAKPNPPRINAPTFQVKVARASGPR
ncbi:hypothetical protein I545_0720 [Mycobacterium kansasii 662]|uniref:Uncharacterized protein n=2 Tax=Mycobacterium kansasii TaxID=1768 RepID=A0A1V3Y1B0_MYCKA|nr:hypothetical protein I547_0604 [Mycobacterium kansasii 824]EUA20742.1 hypothetical protein I545_0720 [Mycobacterium kansasii 662]OOK81842.1 hypothetical protein BZL30_1062 [Mycobacterium kansasii]OOK84541.1 hypothetical protein BZL29_0857 [Mycobacterium kansasii]